MNERLEEIGGDARTVEMMTLGALHQILHLHNSLQHFIYICIFMCFNRLSCWMRPCKLRHHLGYGIP